jgi:hypothetical protein
MSGILATAPQDLQHLKQILIDGTGLGKDALHVYAGLAMFLTVRLLWRWRFGWIMAWLSTLSLALGVEWLDVQLEQSQLNLRPDAEHWHDIWNTMFWPTMLLLVGRWLQPDEKPSVQQSGDFADEAFEQTTPL